MKSLLEKLSEPIDGRYLAWFRILVFGLTAVEVTELKSGGYLNFVLSGTDIRFPYEFLPIAMKFTDQQVDLLYAMVMLSAGLCAIGLLYRFASWMFLISYSFLFFQDKILWNNHWYLFVLIGILAVVINMAGTYSLDVLLKPEKKQPFVARWNYIVFGVQIGLVYFFGGVAKVNSDWLVNAEPIGTFLSQRTEYPILGILFQQSWAKFFFAYTGALFDLGIVFLLFWKRAWITAVVSVLIFNGLNSIIFDIGVFPFFMIGSLLVFYQVKLNPVQSNVKNKIDFDKISAPTIARYGITALLIFQLIFPFRQFLYKGSPSWIGICERFSWRMMIQTKDIQEFEFYVYDRLLEEEQPVQIDVSPRQRIAMVVFPDMIAQYAEGMRQHIEKQGTTNIEIRARIQVKMNAGKFQFLVDKEYDLSREERLLWESPKYVLPQMD